MIGLTEEMKGGERGKGKGERGRGKRPYVVGAYKYNQYIHNSPTKQTEREPKLGPPNLMMMLKIQAPFPFLSTFFLTFSRAIAGALHCVFLPCLFNASGVLVVVFVFVFVNRKKGKKKRNR